MKQRKLKKSRKSIKTKLSKMLKTKKNTNATATAIHKRNTTKKISLVEKLNKCPRSRINGMESYKINCGKNLLLGYYTIKASEETSMHKDEFVHVVLSKLKDYDKTGEPTGKDI